MTATNLQIPERIPPRERIIAAARDLFYRHGIRAVGVEAIAEAAGTNKMTLYRHFESKGALVAEYLRGLATEKHGVWSALEAAHPGDPRAQLQAWLVEAARHVSDPRSRGCALAAWSTRKASRPLTGHRTIRPPRAGGHPRATRTPSRRAPRASARCRSRARGRRRARAPRRRVSMHVAQAGHKVPPDKSVTPGDEDSGAGKPINQSPSPIR